MPESSLSRFITGFLLSATFAAVAWGTLAFGAVYPWAYVPLAVACGLTGLLALALLRRSGPGITPLTLAFGLLAAGIALQLMPLSRPTRAAISPSTDGFLNRYAVGYAVTMPPELEVSRPAAMTTHPLSIDPQSTARGFLLFTAFALFLLGLTRLFSASGALVAVTGLAITGAALAVFAVVQYALSGGDAHLSKIYGFWTPMYPGSPFGSFVNRNHFAGWMLMVAPLAAGAAYGALSSGLPTTDVRDRAGWVSRRSEAGRMQLMALAAVAMALSILVSRSRSGMVALAVEGVILGGCMLRHETSRQGRRLVAAVMTTAVVVTIGWAGLDRVLDRRGTVSPDLASGVGRLGAWRDARRIALDFPLAGTGLNTFGTAMILYQTETPDRHYREAHNDYLQLAAEGGVLLIVPIVLVVVMFVRSVRKRFAEAPGEGRTYWIRVGSLVALAGIACQSLVEFSLQMPANAAVFAVVAAVALHRSPKLRARAPRRRL